ncbi:LAMI_0B02080g1_1 [Lachancea mirantina]|uniref:LAMI_0B02080g1_1 n=1 Tax=Lachancea mirantina TaxID=1230905 RepID=A0A1G4ITZ6_9SACH|nr:LAMI_0B02080g1_1 [Lachancea mirantina]
MVVKVGFVPEHFSTPLHFALTKGYYQEEGVNVQLIPYPSGSGHLIQSLNSGELDVAVGLTEAFVRGIADTEKGTKPNYQIAGTYVESPLEWAVSTGTQRDDLLKLEDMEGGKVGVSRIGSGSYVMSFVLALQLAFRKPFTGFLVCNTFASLRESVNAGTSDMFMWEYFTSKKYYDSGAIKMVGSIKTPWSSWVLVKRTALADEEYAKLARAISRGIAYFNAHGAEAVDFINANFDYSKEDAAAWLKTVTFRTNVAAATGVAEMVRNTVKVLKTANVLLHGDAAAVLDANVAAGLYCEKEC